MIVDYQTRLSSIKTSSLFQDPATEKKYTRVRSIWEVHQHQETEISHILSDFENNGVQLQLDPPYTNELLQLLRDFTPWVHLYHQIEERHDIFLPTDEVHPERLLVKHLIIEKDKTIYLDAQIEGEDVSSNASSLKERMVEECSYLMNKCIIKGIESETIL